MIFKPYEVGDLVEYVIGCSTGTLGVVVELHPITKHPIVDWLNGTRSQPDYDRIRRVEVNNAV
mgnify:CR=1 FL=1